MADNDGAGQLTDVAGGLKSTATQWTVPSGDPLVAAAFLLGWRVGLALSWATDGKRQAWPDDEPGLDDDERWSILKGQIERGAAKITGRPVGGEADEPAIPERRPRAPDPQAAGALTDVRAELAGRLYVEDHFRGMAFALGGRLEAVCIDGGADALAQAIPELSQTLLALATSLPPNAAHSVLNSLALWKEQLRAERGLEYRPERLREQGGIWRSILAGDVAGRDLLHLSDYVGTAEQVVASLHDLALKALWRHLLVPALLVLLFLVGGIALLLFSDKVAAGATSVVAALGLSWKGIGQYLGKAAAKGEQALWNGQIDWTIAYRATISLATPAPMPRGLEARWARMRRAGGPSERRSRSHYEIWQEWLYTWPDFELDR